MDLKIGRHTLLLLGGLILLIGCGRGIHTPYEGDPKNSPFNGVQKLCKRVDGKFNEDPVTVTQNEAQGNGFLSQGGGCVLKPLTTAWAAARERPVLTWDRATLLEILPHADPRAPISLFSTYEAGFWPFTQSWRMQWLHSVLTGDVSAPKKVLIVYKKIEGTPHIVRWNGAIELEWLEEGVTSVLMKNEIEASRTGSEEALGAVRDFILRLRR